MAHTQERTPTGGGTLGRFGRSKVGRGGALLGLALSAAMGSMPFAGVASANMRTSAAYASPFVKPKAPVKLTVVTDAATCKVVVDGDQKGESKEPTSSTSTSKTWVFDGTAGDGQGVKTATVVAYNVDTTKGGRPCNILGPQASASYRVDSTMPSASAQLTSAQPVGDEGWHRSDVTVDWVGQDDVSKTKLSPATDSVTSETSSSGVEKTTTVTDEAGNTGTGRVTVKLDKTAPKVGVKLSTEPNTAGWHSAAPAAQAEASDALSGIYSKDADKTLSEGSNQTVTMSARDKAGNVGTGSTTGVNVDLTGPTLAPEATAAPNRAGWYNGDVEIAWNAADALSGLEAAAPANTVITGEGSGLTATQSVRDKAGHSASATSAPVNIDRTAPGTSVTAPSGWTNTGQTLTLVPGDALSGVAATYFTVDGGQQQSGTSVSISGEGVHTLEYWSVDHAGNEEQVTRSDGTRGHKTLQVKIDGTSPTITPSHSPAANAAGWNSSDVTVSFECSDDASGIASCTPDKVVGLDGKGQQVEGSATDNAGNSARAVHTVNLDTVAPTVDVLLDRAPNAHGWFGAAVTATTSANDDLSGVVSVSPDQVLTEGAGQTVTGTAADAAGNSARKSRTGINVDTTPPLLSGAATTSPNGKGWYTSDVAVAWTASDALSQLDGPTPTGSTIAGEGRGLSASETVTDRAGNRTSRNVAVDIDRTAPQTTATVPTPLVSGWYAGPVRVSLAATDAISGVDQTFYSVDGGTPQIYTAPFTHDLKGEHTITFWSTDEAGLAEDSTVAENRIVLRIDGIAPTIAGSRTPAANAHGWVNEDVLVGFACDDRESGIASCSDATVLRNEGANQRVDGVAVDIAGNRAGASVTGLSIDKQAPTLTGAPTRSGNAAGWYAGDVTIAWDAEDGLSGIDPATQPASVVITGEGRDLSAGPVTVTDKAGNLSLPAGVGGIKIDRNAPVVTVNKPAPNGLGWYGGNVTIGYTCIDPDLADGTPGSGVASCPDDQVISGNLAGQSTTSAGAADEAGNTTAGVTTSGINIDGLPPITTADNQCTRTNGYCTGSTATVVLTSADQTGLSGVKEIRYRVNGGSEEVAGVGSGLTVDSTTGVARVSVNVPLDGSGEASVTYYAVDRADNKEVSDGVALRYDNIAPSIGHTVTPKPNADGWNNREVLVHFDAKDNDGGSGLASVTADVTVSTETAGTTITGEATDTAGNRATDPVVVKLDVTAPSNDLTVTPAPGVTRNAAGWYNGPVTVNFTCVDSLSGIAVCPEPVTVTANGTSDVIREAKDKAGNATRASVLGIKVDDAAPTFATQSVRNGAIYILGAEPAAACSGSDGTTGSGVASCTVVVAPATAGSKVGTMNYVATVTDIAGNITLEKGAYRVVYRYDGFLQPITDTNHDKHLTAISTYKAGQTIPAKFQLKKADGTPVQAAALPGWATPLKGSLTLEQVNTEGSTTALADSGADYRWDSTDRQYVYNWKTAASQAGSKWTIGVVLDDGNTYPVTVALR